jgi:serine/threonine protein kinase
MSKKYPTGAEILTSIKNPNIFFKEDFLKKGSSIKSGTVVIQYSGAFCAVFPFNTSLGKKAVRVWTCEVDHAQEKTKKVGQYLKNLNSAYFVNFDYKEDALLINGTYYSIVIMDWIEGAELKEYIGKNISNKAQLLALADEFKRMVKFLHSKGLSHGDLQHRNIMVTKTGKLLLVDYDSFYVPGMECFKDTIKGLPGYQHPRREYLKNLPSKSDYFSELVIYLSIIVYAENSKLWKEGTEHLLFSKEDLDNYKTSAIINDLRQSKNEEIAKLSQNLIDFLKETDISNLKPLEEVSIDNRKQILDGLDFTKCTPQKPKTPPITTKPDIDAIGDFPKKNKLKTPPKTVRPDIDIFQNEFKKQK